MNAYLFITNVPKCLKALKPVIHQEQWDKYTINQQILAAIKFDVSQNKVIWRLLNLASPPSMQCTIDVIYVCWRQILAKTRNSPNSPNIIPRQNLLIYSIRDFVIWSFTLVICKSHWSCVRESCTKQISTQSTWKLAAYLWYSCSHSLVGLVATKSHACYLLGGTG